MNEYMKGTTPRPADLEGFINVLSINHKLSSQEQQLLDELVLSRSTNSRCIYEHLGEMRAIASDLKHKLETEKMVSSSLQETIDSIEQGLEYKYNEVVGLEERVYELQEEASNWEALTIELGEKLDEAECRIEELEELEHQVKQREWEELLDQVKQNSSPPSSARQCDCMRSLSPKPPFELICTPDSNKCIHSGYYAYCPGEKCVAYYKRAQRADIT